MTSSGSKTHPALAIEHVDGKPGQVYYPLRIIDLPTPQVGASQVLLKPTHLSLNHRDLFIRQALYPGYSPDHPLLSDACTELVAASNGLPAGARVLVNPGQGWAEDPNGPEGPYSVVGGVKTADLGLAQQVAVVDTVETVQCPEHLTGEEAAALPLVGLTAWRALVTKSGAAQKGKNILITGIGGGVATMALSFAVAMGVRVWVSSSDTTKIDKAKQLGAEGGVSYKDKDWNKQLKQMLPSDRPYLDAVIDGAGGDIVDRVVRLLKPGGVIVSYGMTLGPKMSTSMSAVLQNIDIRGSTMGSRKEFKEMVAFTDKNKIRPVVSRVIEGRLSDLKAWDELFDEMREGRQFGKLVFRIVGSSDQSKL